ncbi:MAG TPA: helix-turn-helix domain-containing protein [Acidimicrobiales bacterium]|nr:helix-turn-helix domain-containing protein [Acidimicrobiales bacterium]
MPSDPLAVEPAPRVPFSADDFTSAVTAITSAFGDPTRRQIYLFAHERTEGVTASEVAEHFDLHANVARHHLDKLAGGGYLEVRVGRGSGGAGRPSKRFAVAETDVALDFPVKRDDLVLSLLSRALELLPQEVAEAMAEDVGVSYGKALAASLQPGGAQRSFRAALHAVADALTAHGFAAHTEEGGDGVQIVSDHCPFGGAAVVSPVVCAVDRGMVKGMLGALYGETDPETSMSRALGDDTCITAVHG